MRTRLLAPLLNGRRRVQPLLDGLAGSRSDSGATSGDKTEEIAPPVPAVELATFQVKALGAKLLIETV